MLTLERKWDRRVQQWHSHVTSAVAFEKLLEDMLKIAAPRPADACVDLGAGTGFVTMALAPLTSSVLAVDISGAMASALAARAKQDGLGNVSTQVGDLRTFDLRPSSTDLVVSSYALHHLVDADKRALVARSAQWLRPGGWWRIAKNLVRFGLGVGQEHPATPEFWQAALRDAGFADVSFHPVVAEAGIVSGVRPRGLPADATMG